MTLLDIGFDADDTLWHCENLFAETQAELQSILEAHAPHEEVEAKLHATELENVKLFGFGIKGFTLSMVETAVQISGGRITGDEVHRILMMGKRMLEAPVDLMPGVREVLEGLRNRYRLILITKGDVLDQTNKVDKSRLGHLFDAVEVVQHKNVAAYGDVFDRHRVRPDLFMMVGNSIPSDILPVLELGGWAVHIPYEHVAIHERHGDDPAHDRFRRLDRLSDLPALIDTLHAGQEARATAQGR